MQGSPDAIQAVSQRLERFVSARVDEAADAGPLARPILELSAATLQGGKRLRAAFCYWGWRSVTDATGTDEIVAAAAALEVFHAAALVHDDIIDNSDTRRGHPATHRAFEGAHLAGGWTGDAAAYGRSSAILAGDLLVAWSDDLFEEGIADAPADRARAARRRYAEMRRDVTVGQYLDIAAETVPAPDAEQLGRALHVASFKSARYSVQQPLLIGAAIGGGSTEQQEALRDFGHPIGMAFQLRDDVLGVFGDSAATGKPSGDDLREGKRTALIAFARQELPASVRRTLDELLGDPDLEDTQVRMLQDTIRDSGALDRVEDLIASYTREADRALSGAPLDNASVGALRDLARAAVHRVA
ncbi:Geranylgeranyl pyrophosphate synthase [Microbacterium sp. C448]|uniref:polyprenyl synthetase family protein n=1 Tax=Microbacterium TaxID=33882 RepID=UPI0003DE584F|nr:MULTISPECIES: polyprenyl synthetase family protein [Microbacterium]CDK01005.1 Geranylgeranyl pyrophosphate synthase [Microbacterium sp. C448]